MTPSFLAQLRRVVPQLSFFALVILSSCGASQGPVGTVVSMEERLGEGSFRSGRVDLGQPAGRALLGTGWREEPSAPALREGALMASPSATLWLPSLDGEGASLAIQASAQGKPSGSFRLEVLLGEESLGRVDLKAQRQRYPFEIPGGRLQRGLNRLELRVERSNGVKGGLPVRVGSAEIAGSSTTSGRSLSMRLPAAAQLAVTARAELELLVQDAETLELIAEYRGEHEALFDLGRDFVDGGVGALRPGR